MSISLGVWEVFAYTVPGSLYLALGAFVASKLGWIDLSQLVHLPTILLAGGILVLSYVLGLIAHPVAHMIDWLPKRPRAKEARASFIERTPAAARRSYVHADMALLRAAVEVKDKELSLEIARIGATWHMMRNCAVVLALGSAASIACALTGGDIVEALTACIVLAAGAAASVGQYRRYRRWWYLKTLETCYWFGDIDKLIDFSNDGNRNLPAEVPPHSAGIRALMRIRRHE